MCSQQITGAVVMALAGGTGKLNSFCTVADSGSGRHGEKLIGDFGQCAYDDYRAFGKTLAYDGRDPIDGLGVLHRGAAKFHDDHEGTPENTHHGGTEARRKQIVIPRVVSEQALSSACEQTRGTFCFGNREEFEEAQGPSPLLER